MSNSQTAHSKRLRSATSAARRARILAEGGRDLRVLLTEDDAKRLGALQELHGATATDVIKRLLASGGVNYCSAYPIED